MPQSPPQEPVVDPEDDQSEADRTPDVEPAPLESDLRFADRSGTASHRPAADGGIDCPRCGERSNSHDSFCNSCGLPFDDQEHRQPAVEQAIFRYGGVLERFVARLIDGFILFSVLIAILVLGGSDRILNENNEFSTQFNIIWFLVVLAYHSLFVSVFGTTPGKRVMGLRVSATSGRRPWFGQAAFRELFTIISTLTLLVGYLIALFRPDRRTLHDLLAGTVVVSDKP